MEVQDFRAFGDAIVRKLEREIQPQLSGRAWSAPTALNGRTSSGQPIIRPITRGKARRGQADTIETFALHRHH